MDSYMPTTAARELVASLKEVIEGAAARGVEAGAGFVVIPPEKPGGPWGIAIPYKLADTPSAEAESVLCRDIVPQDRPLGLGVARCFKAETGEGDMVLQVSLVWVAEEGIRAIEETATLRDGQVGPWRPNRYLLRGRRVLADVHGVPVVDP